MDKLRIAVVGCNNMGKKHVAVLRGHFADRVEIAGILNSSVESSARVAAELNVPYFKNLDDIDRKTADAVIVATPGVTHAEIGAALLARGLPCLIEKPLATTPSGCEKLIAAAGEGQTFILPGHSENYNSAERGTALADCPYQGNSYQPQCSQQNRHQRRSGTDDS